VPLVQYDIILEILSVDKFPFMDMEYNNMETARNLSVLCIVVTRYAGSGYTLWPHFVVYCEPSILCFRCRNCAIKTLQQQSISFKFLNKKTSSRFPIAPGAL
jgi:hypothetical protein